MDTVTLEKFGRIALLRLTNGVTNAIGPALVAELSAVLAQVKSEFNGCVMAGGTKFFSIGLDLPRLIDFDREAMSRFWDDFDQTVLDWYCVPLPTAAAIDGHAIAGGTILALAADFRLVTEGRKLMGLNEINIGLPVPYLADLMLRQILNERAATEMVYKGELIPPQKSLKVGLVDEIENGNRVEPRALELIEALAQKPQPAFRLAKRNRTQTVCLKFETHRRARKEDMLDCWFQPSVRELLEKATEKF